MIKKSFLVSFRNKAIGISELLLHIRNLEEKFDGNMNNNGFWKLRTFRSFKLLLDSRSMVDATILKQGDWEEDSWSALMQVVEKVPDTEKVFLDVGSYFGLYALKAYESKKYSRIVAFEADKVNASQLRANLLLNDLLSEIDVFETFLSDSAGQKNMATSSNWLFNRGMSGTEDHRAVKRVLVESRSLDSVISSNNQFIVMKVDVEGSELAVLNGCRNLFDRNRVLLLIENVSNSAEQKELLSTLGFNQVCEISKDSNWIWKNYN